MNSLRVFQLSILILLEICGITKGDHQADCVMTPTDAKTVEVVVYINGGTADDILWLSRYCAWLIDGMPYDTYAPVTIKVGGEITCDNNNKCNCPSFNKDQGDCTITFEHVCAEQILGQNKFKELMCCSQTVVDEASVTRKGFKTCVDEQSGLADKISTCMAKQGPGSPQDVAVKNAKKVAKKVKMADNSEPFFFYNGIFDKCISDDSPYWFIQKICSMLKKDIALSINQCKAANVW